MAVFYTHFITCCLGKRPVCSQVEGAKIEVVKQEGAMATVRFSWEKLTALPSTPVVFYSVRYGSAEEHKLLGSGLPVVKGVRMLDVIDTVGTCDYLSPERCKVSVARSLKYRKS